MTVSIKRIASRKDPPGAELEYEVRNESADPIWLVDDGWLTWRQRGQEIELSYARGKMTPGSQVFGYFPPSVVKVEAGDGVSRGASLCWPQPLDRLWNSCDVATPRAGRYLVSVRVGYGRTPSPPPPVVGEGVEASVHRWQREAASQPAPMDVIEGSSHTGRGNDVV